MDFWSWRGGVFEFVRATSPVTPTFGAIRIEPAVVRRDDSELGKKSLELQQEIAELMAEDADSPLLGSLYQDLGLVERDRGDWDAAERWTRQALTIYERIGNRQRLVLCWGVLGDIENNRGNWNAAERLYRQSLQLCEELGDRSGIATSLGCLGQTELGRGNLDDAEAYLKDALAQMQQLGMTASIAETHWDLAQLETKRHNPSAALTHYTTAHTLLAQLGDAKDLEKIEQEWNALE